MEKVSIATPVPVQQQGTSDLLVKHMDIIQKLQQETNNVSHIYLYANKGIFVNAYEKSAFSLIKSGFNVKPVVSYNSKMKMSYVFVGLHAGTAEQNLKGKFKNIIKSPIEKGDVYVITLPMPIFSETEYTEWKESVIRNEQETKVCNTDKTDNTERPSQTSCNEKYMTVINTIKNLSLADMSPMEAINFLNNIQQQLRHE